MKRNLSKILIILGILLILSPLLTTAYSLYQQRNLFHQLEQNQNQLSYAQSKELVKLQVSSKNTELDSAPIAPIPKIEAILILKIPRLNINAAVVKGVTSRDLSVGPGLYPNSSLPNNEGNVAIAGHRNIFGSWFRNLDKLIPGDKITIVYSGQVYDYKVEKIFYVAENDWSVVAPTSYKALTLTTCDPPGAVNRRLIVRARQVE
jgi:sortase A